MKAYPVFFHPPVLAQSPEVAAEADHQPIAVLGAVREAEHVAEVAADREVTAYQSVPTISAEVTLTAAMKVRRNKRGLARVNDEEARSEEETNKHGRVLGSTTANTFVKSRELIVASIFLNEKKRGNVVGRRCLAVEVDHEAGVEVRREPNGIVGNTNMTEKRRNARTDIVTETEWTTGQGRKDATTVDTADSTSVKFVFSVQELPEWKIINQQQFIAAVVLHII